MPSEVSPVYNSDEKSERMFNSRWGQKVNEIQHLFKVLAPVTSQPGARSSTSSVLL